MKLHNATLFTSSFLAIFCMCLVGCTTTPPSSSEIQDDALDDQGNEGDPGDEDEQAGNVGDEAGSGTTSIPGAGTAGAGLPLVPGVGPETSDECGAGKPSGGSAADSEVIEISTDCFWGPDDSEIPAAAIEQIIEIVDDVEWIHIRLTLDPRFVDNTYGENAIGWGGDDGAAPEGKKKKKTGHTFDQLVGSDHAEMILKSKNGDLVLQFKIDYISENSDFPSGYGSNGVSDKDGGMIEGDEKWILGTSTSMHRNFNGCGLDEYTVDSPATDENYTPNPDAPEWDFRVVYEVWVDAAPFKPSGFGEAIIEYVHASPAKQDNDTIEVTKGECPESDEPGVNYWGDDDVVEGGEGEAGEGEGEGEGEGGTGTGDDDCGSDCTYTDTDFDDTPV